MPSRKKKKELLSRLKSKYRLVIMNDDTFEEKLSFRLSPMNVFVVAGTILLSLITFVIYITAFTPLREYIPGYADVGLQKSVWKLSIQVDSLEKKLGDRDKYIKNIKSVLNGQVGEEEINGNVHQPGKYDTIRSLKKSKEDSMIRSQIESGDQYELSYNDDNKSFGGNISSFFFFTPLHGTAVNVFDQAEKHYGIDIVAPKNEAIKSTLDGTVIMNAWTAETGYVISVQHANNIVSIYKHNSVLLKKTGAYVKAGEAIAIIGNSGELTSGPHLHFELWYNGVPINPLDYMSF
jgi:murein DD-endopeptidase MepM/ murein hydrolase activator NlpD